MLGFVSDRTSAIIGKNVIASKIKKKKIKEFQNDTSFSVSYYKVENKERVSEHNRFYIMSIRLQVSTVILILYKGRCVRWPFIYFLLYERISWNPSLLYSAMYSLRTDVCKKNVQINHAVHTVTKSVNYDHEIASNFRNL